MSLFRQRKVVSEYDNSKIAIGFLAAIVLFGVFVVGLTKVKYLVLCKAMRHLMQNICMKLPMI